MQVRRREFLRKYRFYGLLWEGECFEANKLYIRWTPRRIEFLNPPVWLLVSSA